jgi:DNA polymerase-3 subunit gamma/tau
MGYEVTAARRRPKTFDELVGQDFVSATLKNSMESGKIAPAYLFSGPRGCGKTSAARILARALNCERGPTAVPCGECDACREIAKGARTDVIEIDGASNTGVDSVRKIKEEVLYPPTASRYKIYIIDEVHMLSNSAFNALLKTIEEPPPYIIFIFATTELHKVPATIKSRCQHFMFRLIPIERVAEILGDTCREMGIEAEEEALFWIAKESTGSMRDAYTLFDQVAAFSEGHLNAALIREKLGRVSLDKLNDLADASAEGDEKLALTLVDEILQSGIAIEQFITDLTVYYRSLLLVKTGITKESVLGYKPERFSSKTVLLLDAKKLHHALDLLLELYRAVRFSVSPRIDWDNTVLKFCELKSWVDFSELREAIFATRKLLQSSSVQRPDTAATGAASDSGALLRASDDTVGEKKIDLMGSFREKMLNSNASNAANAASGGGGTANAAVGAEDDPVAVVQNVFQGRIVGGIAPKGSV